MIEKLNATLSLLKTQIILNQGTTLAQFGRYSEAERLLGETDEIDDRSKPSVLDILARVKAQQGKFIEAEELWKQVLLINPEDTTARNGLYRIKSILNRPAWLSLGIPLFWGVLLLLCVGLAGVGIKNYRNREIPKETVDGSILEKLNVPGINARNEENDLLITFENGLFDSGGTRLSPAAQKLLANFGNQIKSYKLNAIHITGCTDNVPMRIGQKYQDNISLGIGRATAVAEYLRLSTHLPPGLFYIQSFGESSALRPNDTDENRARNRTVLLKISFSLPNKTLNTKTGI